MVFASFCSFGSVIDGDYEEKWAVPRQSGCVKNSKAVLRLYDETSTVLDILEEGYSHVLILFIFDRFYNQAVTREGVFATKQKQIFKKIDAKVNVPRLDYGTRGCFATRCPKRPNFIGLSVCKIEKVNRECQTLHVSGVDFIKGTPILSVTPYTPECQEISNFMMYPDWLLNGLVKTQNRDPYSIVVWGAGVCMSLELIRKQRDGFDEHSFLSFVVETLAQDVRSRRSRQVHANGIFGSVLRKLWVIYGYYSNGTVIILAVWDKNSIPMRLSEVIQHDQSNLRTPEIAAILENMFRPVLAYC